MFYDMHKSECLGCNRPPYPTAAARLCSTSGGSTLKKLKGQDCNKFFVLIILSVRTHRLRSNQKMEEWPIKLKSAPPCLDINPLPDEQHFFMMHFDAFWRTKSNKFAILVHFLYFFRMQKDKQASCSPADRFASQTKYRKGTKTSNLFWHYAKQI